MSAYWMTLITLWLIGVIFLIFSQITVFILSTPKQREHLSRIDNAHRLGYALGWPLMMASAQGRLRLYRLIEPMIKKTAPGKKKSGHG